MNQRDKEDTVARYLKGAAREKSLSERKQLDRLSRERRANRQGQSSTRRRTWDEDDAAQDFEREYRRSTQRLRHRAPEPRGASHVATHHGQVVGIAAGRARVRTSGGEVDAGLAPHLARTQQTSIAVGDEVGLALRLDGSFLLVDVKERRSTLSRPDPGRPDIERVIAANVDRAVIVVSVREPYLRHRLIDRYLVAVERGGVEPVVVANKLDLVHLPEEREDIDRILATYRELGVPTLTTSVQTGEGIDQLATEITGRTVVFVGQSGVGKSSLVTAVAPDLELGVGRVRHGDGKGRHTTTRSTLFEVEFPEGHARIIDTPGIRGFKLAGVSRENLASLMPDLADLAPSCRFSNCMHEVEPGCRVREAAEAGELSSARYDTYLRVLRSID